MPIVANGRFFECDGQEPSLECRLAVIEFLQEVLTHGCIVVDLAGAIVAEYHRYLQPHGQPGVGDRFYLEILNSAPGRVERVHLPMTDAGEYEDFPNVDELADFDQSDRKFAALAHRERIPVANAIDSDWLNYADALAANGISVNFVCSQDRRHWFIR